MDLDDLTARRHLSRDPDAYRETKLLVRAQSLSHLVSELVALPVDDPERAAVGADDAHRLVKDHPQQRIEVALRGHRLGDVELSFREKGHQHGFFQDYL